MKKIVAVLLVAISLLFSINFAFADSVPLSSTQWVLPSNGFGGGSRANPVDTVLPYSDMASLLSSVNSGLKSGAYSGFTGKARISYTGSFYFITLVSDGDTYWLCNGSGGRYRTEPENITTDSTTTTPSTNAPTTTPSTTEAGNGANGTYIPTHSAASNDTGLLRQIAQYTHEIWFWADLINDNLRDVRRYLFMVYSNVGRFVDGMNNITKGIYRQIDLLSGYLPRLDDIYNRLFQIQSAAWASVDVENRLLYSLEDLASNISGVIVDGAVKVTSSPDPAVAEAITGIQSTLTSVISNGKVLVNNSDVVSAIQSIPAFDDTDLLDRVGTIVEQIDTLSRKIDLNYFPNMYGKVTSIADTLGNTNKHLITANRKTTEIVDMLTAAVDEDTGKLLVADTAVTSAIADLTDSLTVPTGKCAHDWQLTSTGQPGTPAVTNVRLPAEYQEVEYLENTSEGAYINTGAVPSLSGTKFHIKYQMLSGSYLFGCGQIPRLACFMNANAIQVYLGNTGLSGIVGYTKTGLYSNIVDLAGFLTGAETGRYVDVTVDGVTSRVTPPDGAISGSFSDSLPFYLFAWRYGDTLRSGTGRIWGFSMEINGNLIRDMVPCYRKSDNAPGFYDLVSGSFSTNAGTGSFVTGADVPVTIITPEAPTTYDTYTCSICGETYVDYDSTGAPEVTGVAIPFTRWFHGKFQEYEASLLSAIDAIPAYDDAAVIAAIQSIPAPTDYTSQLTAVTGRMDDILAQLQSTSGSATCEHTYSQHMEQEATCILPGLMISTCSKCGDSSSEIVDPLGHDWQCTSHVEAVTDPDTGEETSSAYDIYTCSRCGDTYEDHTGTGAPDEDYSNTTISQLVVKVFSKLGTFAGKLLGSVVHLFDKAVNAVDDLASKFNDYVEQIKGFGENYPIWLSGFWGIIPAELQVALTFAVICMALGVVGKKLSFS